MEFAVDGRASVVRAKGLEPPRPKPPDPKSGVSTNSTTPAARCPGPVWKNGPDEGAPYTIDPMAANRLCWSSESMAWSIPRKTVKSTIRTPSIDDPGRPAPGQDGDQVEAQGTGRMDGMITEKNLRRPGKALLLLWAKRQERLVERSARLDLGKNHQRASSQYQIDLAERCSITLGHDAKTTEPTAPGSEAFGKPTVSFCISVRPGTAGGAHPSSAGASPRSRRAR